MPGKIPDKLLKALQKIDRPGSFCTSGSLAAVMPGLEVNGLGPVGLPLSADQAARLKERCDQAPYGKGTETVVDTNVRRVWQLPTERFRLTNPDWQPFLAGIVLKVQEGLGLEGRKLQSHLYNLLLYEPGSFFLPHRDGEKLDRMVATLVVVLPCSYEGGELVIRHEGREETIDFSAAENSQHRVHFAGFYADCEHEIRPLREGHRLCLVYNLTLAKGASKQGLAAPRFGDHVEAVGAVLGDWRADDDAPPKLAVLLGHKYTQGGLRWDVLKGVDAARARVLGEAARRTDCMAYLGLLTFHETGAGEPSGGYDYDDYGEEDDEEGEEDDGGDYEMVEVIDSSLTGEHFTDGEGRPLPLDELDVEPDEVVPPDGLTAVKPEEEFEGYTGNAGMTLDRWYRHAAVFLWPRERHFEVLCGGGGRAALGALDQMVQDWRKAGKKAAGPLGDQCREFARQVIAAWGPGRSYYGRERQPEPLDLSAVLAQLDDADLVRRFLRDAVARDASLEVAPALRKVVEKHGWPAFRDELVAVFRETTSRTLLRNVGLLEQVCAARAAKKSDDGEPRRGLAEETLKAVESIDRATDDWEAKAVDRSEVIAGMVRSLASADLPDLLDRFVDHVLATPKRYSLTPVQTKAVTTLGPWLAKHVKEPSEPLSRWLTACRQQLESLTARMPTEPTDQRRDADVSCKCANCAALKKFLASPAESTFRLQARQDLRQHLEEVIRRDELDVDCTTDRRPRPQVLICTKNTASHGRRLKKYHEDRDHLAKLLKVQASLPTTTP